MQQDPLTLDNSRKTQLDSNIKKMLEGGASNDDVMSYASDFKNKFGVKKKDDFQVDSQIGSEPLPIGSKPFQAQVDTKIPSVLTEQGKVGYEQEIAKPRPKEKPILDFSAIKNSPKPRDAYYQDPTIAAREEKARLKQLQKNYEAGKLDRNTFTQDLNLVAASGIDMLGRMASTIPSGILDNAIQAFGNQPGGLVSMGIDAEVLGKIAEKKLGLPEEYNPLSPNNALAETFRKKAELNQSLSRKGYSGGITDALKLGEYKDAAKLLAFGFTESLPILLGLAATRGSGMSSTGSLISTGLGTQATTYQDLKTENPEIAKNILFLNATLTGIGEAGSEVTGTNLLYNQARKLFVKGQKEQAKEIVTKGIKEYLDYAFQKSFVGSAVLGDMSGEVANQIWKNATDKWSGVRPDVDYLDGVGDAALISAFTTSTIAAGAKSLAAIVNPKTKDKIDDTSLKISNLQKEADNPDMPDAARTVIVNEIGNLTESINEDLKKDNVQYNDLDDDQKTTVDNLSDKRDEIKSALNNAAISDETKQVLQKQLNDIDLQIESILSTKPTPEQKLETPKSQEDAVQVETTGQVPVQPEAPVSEEVEQGKPEAEPKVVAEEGVKAEEVAFTSKGGNKLVDESGNPLLLYHGTSKGIKATDLKQSGQAGDYGEGIYFATDKTEAEQRNPENIIEANVKSDNHLVIGSKEYFDGIYKKLEQRFGSVIPQYAIGQEAKKAGYTSIEVDRPNGKFVIVFDGAKIKEATIVKESKKEQTPAQEVEQLRAEEQAELYDAIPNADQYLTDGKVDRAKIKNAKDLKKFDKIYKKYDNLITPLLPKKGKTELEIKKEAFDKAKEMVAAIRGLKIDGKGKAFDATLGLPVAIWNGAIETVATAIEAGVAVADAIKRGLNYIQKNNRGAWNKKAYNDRVIEELGLRGIEVNGEDLIVQPLEDKATVELVNGFYSPLEKGIAEAKTDKATGKGWMKVLSGVTEADELNYTGVKDFLNSNADRPISRKELLDYMKNNRIEVVEVVLGAKEALSKEAMNDVYNGINEQLSRTNQPDEIVEFVNEKLNDWYNNPTDKNYKSLYAALGEVNLSLDDFIESAEDRMDDTKFSQYQLEGEKENYKELLVTLPIKEKNEIARLNGLQEEARVGGDNERVQYYEERINKIKSPEFKSSHFDEPNILVHLRMNTRTDSEGNKVLFLEEVQSDWGQKGKREGFGDQNKKAIEETIQNKKDRLEAIEKEVNEIGAKTREMGLFPSSSSTEIKNFYNGITRETRKLEAQLQTVRNQRDWDAINKRIAEIKKEIRDIESKQKDLFQEQNLVTTQLKGLEFQLKNIDNERVEGVPSAPFVTDTNAWTKLGLKTALKEAVAQGADKLAWTTGEQQNDRYDLSKIVDQISIAKQVTGDEYVVVGLKDNDIVVNQRVKESELEGIVGKEIASKAINEGQNVFKGKDLAVGGKGMKGFYGSPSEGSLGIVGGVAEKLFGQKVGTVEIENKKGKIRKASWGDGEVYELVDENGNVIGNYGDKDAAMKAVSTSTQYSIDITPELKQAVKEGIPLFKNELTQAKEKLKEASAALSKLNKNLGIYSDPEQNARALFEYHKALVGLAKAYIKAGVNSVKDFAKEIGENITQEVKDAWNEAKGISKKTLSDFKEEAEKLQVKGEKERLAGKAKLNESNVETAIELLDEIEDNKRKAERASSKRKAELDQKIADAESELESISKEAKIVKAINDNFDKIKKDLKEQGLLNVKC